MEKLRQNLPKYLFNRRVISLPQVTSAQIARVAGTTKAGINEDGTLKLGHEVKINQVRRWLQALRLDRASAELDPLADEVVGAWLTSNLPFDQLWALYEWARKERLDREVPAEHRGYAMERQQAKRRNKAAEHAKNIARKNAAKELFKEL